MYDNIWNKVREETRKLDTQPKVKEETPKKRRGRPPKPEGAMSPKERKRLERDRKRIQTEAERQAAIEKLEIEAIRAWERRTGLKERFSQIPKDPKDIEKIYAGKMKAGQVLDGEYTDVTQGRRVTPEGFGRDKDQEGFATSAALARQRTGFRNNSAAPAQEYHAIFSRYWEQHDKEKLRAAITRDFLGESFYPVLYCPLSRPNEIQAWLRCNLCSHTVTRNSEGQVVPQVLPLWSNVIDTWTRDEDDDGEYWVSEEGFEQPDEDPVKWVSEFVWADALDHVEKVHHKELKAYIRGTLPAWAEGSKREQQFTAPREPQKCSVDHETQRLAAVAREEKSKVYCGRCRRLIYKPMNYRDTPRRSS